MLAESVIARSPVTIPKFSIPELLQTALFEISLPADWLSLRVVSEVISTRSVRDGNPIGNSKAMTQGAMVEVLAAGQLGYAATNVLTIEGLQMAAQQAYQQAIAAAAWSVYRAVPRPAVTGHYTSPLHKPLDILTVGEINDVLIKLCQTMKVSEQIVQTSATVITEDVESWMVSSNGSDTYQHFFKVMTDYGATAQEGTLVQRRTDNGWLARCYQGGMECFLQPDLWERAQQIGEQAVELLTAMECPTETTTLMLAPDQMLLQIHESVGHPLEIDRILGDERNYAGGSFVRASDIGSLVYGSPLMNITFDPTVPGELASYGFDDTGMIAQREFLIKDGILLRGLGGLESQQRSGLPGVACQRASSWNRPPIDRMANLNLEPGDLSTEAMIANIERGVYMETNRSWSIDDQRHKFQFGCEYAKLIENGKMTKTLRNPNYRSTTPQFWQSLIMVGDRASWQMYGSPVCGKGEPNQCIWVGHGSPACVFRDIEVFGGG